MSAPHIPPPLFTLPVGYEVVSSNGLRVLRHRGQSVTVFAAETPLTQVVLTAIRDAAYRAGISARDLQIMLSIMSGEAAEDVARQWGLLPAQTTTIVSATASRLWETPHTEGRQC